MAKKTALAKKPPVTPEAWIQEADNQPEPKPTGETPIVRVTFEFPQDLHRKMKGKAGAEGWTLKEVMMSFGRQWVEGKISPSVPIKK